MRVPLPCPAAQVNCQGRTNKKGQDGRRTNWEATEIKFHVGDDDGAQPCKSTQLAAVHACVANCKKCKKQIDLLKKMVVSGVPIAVLAIRRL